MIKTTATNSVTTCVSFATEAVMSPPVFRHRSFLRSGASWRALLAVQAAMSVGITLPTSAQAQTSLNDSNTTIYLSNYSAGSNPFYIFSGTHIGTALSGVDGIGGAYVLDNAGTVISAGANAVQLGSGSMLTNTGTIVGWKGGTAYGAEIYAGPGSVSNAGTITGFGGVLLTHGGQVSNSGSIIGIGVGVTITGEPGIVLNNGTAANYIAGGVAGVDISSAGGTIINRGLITQSSEGFTDAAAIMNGGYLYNQAAGTSAGAGVISGYANGVIGNGTTALDIVNNGTIIGTGVNVGPWTNGIILGAAGGTITNGTGALINGADGNGILSNNGGLVINNSGTISGGRYAIDSYNYLTMGSNLGVSVTNSGTIAGGNGGIYAGTGYTTIHNTGLINGADGNGVEIEAAGSVYNTGIIAGTGSGIFGGTGAIDVSNFGQITGSFVSGVNLNAGGAVYNSGVGVISGVYDGVYIEGGVGSVTNLGLITASKYSGVELDAGGSVNNQGSIYGAYAGVQAGYAGQTISHVTDVTNSGSIIGNSVAGIIMFGGGDEVQNQFGGTIAVLSGTGSGVVMYGGTGSVNNAGLVLGGATGTGVNLAGGGTVYNYGSISGGVGVKTGSVASYVLNIGTIIGDTIGVKLQHGGFVNNNYSGGCQSNVGVIYGSLTGVEIDSAPGSVTNYGYIGGGGRFNTVGTGILLNDGGAVSNLGGVYNGALISGLIIGGNTGVQAQGGGASIFNIGTIYGHNIGVSVLDGGSVNNTRYTGTIGVNTYTASGTIFGGSIGIYGGTLVPVSVTNSGVIGATYAGIALLGGGSVTNDDGEIFGLTYGIRIAGPGQVTNTGLIFGESNIGVDLESGGTVSNLDGEILGQDVGVFIGTDPHSSMQTAGTVFNTGYIHASAATGIVMLSGGYVSNSAAGEIIGSISGVYLYAQPTLGNSIFNAGLITGLDTGIYVGGNGAFNLANAAGGTISGATAAYTHNGALATDVISNAGLLQGTSGSGISLDGGAFNVVNHLGGTIIGSVYGLQAAAGQVNVTNSGYITGTNLGMYIGGGSLASVTNLAGGTITSAHSGISESATQFSLDNAGLLNGTDGEALLVSGGALASVTNETTGTITGYYYGLEMDAVDNQVDNKGLISAPDEYYGIQTAGTMAGIVNETGATILGGELGVISSSDNFTLDNAGSINAAYRGVYATGTISNTVINRAGGTITGPDEAIWLDGSLGSVQNSGVLQGDYAVVMETTLGSALNTSTGLITGAYDGIFSEYANAVSNAGLITGSLNTGIQLVDGGEVVNSGSINGGRTGIADYGYLLNQSMSNTVAVFNGVFIDGGNAGIRLGAGVTGDISNADGGLITGGTYGIAIGVSYASAASFGTIFNSGDINGGETGILLDDGGLISNAQTGVITGGTYAVQAGYMIGQTYGTTGIVDNSGRITGGAGGVLLTQGGVVTNTATGEIAGGNIGIQADALTDINNSGLIEGGVTGVNLAAGGTVVNTGNIAGGVDGLVFAYGSPAVLTNAGHITGTLGTGVALAGGALNNQITGVIRGGVDGVLAESGAAIVNAGQILDAPAAGHAGVFLAGNTSLENTATGTISGEVGVLVSGNDATITDAGTIISTDGGDAIQVAPTADPVQITLTTGAKLTGAIDGGGTAGTITLTGQNVLDNTITNFGAGSQLTIAPGAVWTGIGNWTIANVNNTGTFQGGTLNAPLNLTGNFNSTGTLRVIVTPTISSQLIVTGAATLAGKLTYVFAPGTYTPGTKYNFLTASDGATGGFTGVTYLGATPAYVSKTTTVVAENGVLGSNLTLGAGLLTVSPLDASIFSDANQDAALNAEAANDELLGKATGDADNAAACAAAARAMPDATAPRGTSTASRLTGAVANAFCGAGGWIEATGTAMTVDDSDEAPGYTANDAGFLAGIDKPVSATGTRLGLAVGYDDAWLNDKSGGKASAGTVRIGLYAAQPIGIFTLGADLMYGHATDTSTRATGEGDTGGNYGADVINGGVQLSTVVQSRGFDLTPTAGIKFAAVNTDGFSETAPSGLSPFAVKAQSSSYTSVQPFLSLKISKSFTTESLVTITPSVAVGYALEAGNTGKSVNLTSQDGTLFASNHSNLDASGAKLAAGITAGKNNWALYARYVATIGNNYTAQAGEAGLQINF
jgi:fibronectin-binding autotransporter adhesin